MKKMISILLMLCMLVPLAAQAYAADVYSPEALEQLKQNAEGGNAEAMATLGRLYYLGNYKSGVSRDFSRALDWFQRAADAGRQDVLMNLASIYEKGSAGEKDLDKAYSLYKQAAEAGIAGAKEKTEEPQFALFHWKDSVTQLTGRLGDWESIENKSIMPFYLDNPVENCSVISMEMHIVEHTGWPYGLYALYAKGLDGQWRRVDYLNIEKSQEDGSTSTYQFKTEAPISFEALAVVIIEEGMEFNLTHEDFFYVDKANVGAYSDSVPAPVFSPANAQYPVISSAYATSAYVNPYPAG